MKVRDLWSMCTFVGDIQIEDKEHYLSNPLVKLHSEDTSRFMLNNELANAEVDYFDFMHNTLRIIIKEQ